MTSIKSEKDTLSFFFDYSHAGDDAEYSVEVYFAFLEQKNLFEDDLVRRLQIWDSQGGEPSDLQMAQMIINAAASKCEQVDILRNGAPYKGPEGEPGLQIYHVDGTPKRMLAFNNGAGVGVDLSPEAMDGYIATKGASRAPAKLIH